MNKYNILLLVMLTTVAMAPAPSSAYSLGDIRVQSSLGQPFRATIPIHANRGEEIDAGCLRLSPPPAEKDMVYLRRATLSVTSSGDRPQVLISGHYPLDEPYLNVIIALGCKDQGHMTREYTVLIDPPDYTYLPALSSASKEELHPKDGIKEGARSLISDAQPVRSSKKKPRHILKKAKPAQLAKSPRGQLKVMSGAGDKPAQPGLSENERLQQREKELMKELDDKTAKHLEMQAQLAKLESKLAEMQKTLEQQNKLLTSMQQQEPIAVKKTALSWDKDYWLAGPFVLVAGLAYFLARRSRRRSLDDWKPTMRELNTGNSKMQNRKPL